MHARQLLDRVEGILLAEHPDFGLHLLVHLVAGAEPDADPDVAGEVIVGALCASGIGAGLAHADLARRVGRAITGRAQHRLVVAAGGPDAGIVSALEAVGAAIGVPELVRPRVVVGIDAAA